MENPYKERLIELFERIIELRHSSNRINLVLKKDVQRYTAEGARFFSGSKLIISDWTGPTDNGWEINFNTGIRKETSKEDYEREVENIISRECCLSFSQAFEALETFFKDCIYLKSQRKSIFDFKSREEIMGGDKLFRLIKKACSPNYIEFSKNNNNNIRFKHFWTIISKCRHAITHSSCRLKISEINKSKEHFATFEYLFNYSEIDTKTVLIKLDYKNLNDLLKLISEYAYQILKIISLQEDLEYKFN